MKYNGKIPEICLNVINSKENVTWPNRKFGILHYLYGVIQLNHWCDIACNACIVFD